MKININKIISIFMILMLILSFAPALCANAASAVYTESFEGECMDELNKIRKSNGLSNLTYDMTTAKLAGVRAVEISSNFSHTRPGGKASYTVYADYGYTKPKAVGECIGYATRYDGVPDMIDYWMTANLGHREVILNSKYTKFGMASYVANGKTYIVLMLNNKEGTAYIISYNANGGTGAPPSQVKERGTKMTITSTKPTRSGYTFNGWNTKADGNGTTYAAGGTYSTDANATLYASWKSNTAATLTGISVKTMPSKTIYNVGDTLNTANLVIRATYSDGSTKDLTSGFTCSPTKLSTAGTQTITVSYGGKTTTFKVTVNNPVATLTGVSVKTLPSKTTYNVGEYLNTTGLVLKASYSDGSTKDITSGYTCSPSKLSTAGKQTITVTYNGKTATFSVTVNSASSKLKGVRIDDVTINYKSSATLKTTIDAVSGAKYSVKYESSDTKVVTVDGSGKVYGAKKGSATVKVTVTATDGSVVSDTCTVTVKYTAAQWIIIILLFGWAWY